MSYYSGNAPFSYPDQGFCCIHRKKRLRNDLMPCPDQPGRFQCLPHKECRQVELAVCRRHNRKRNVLQMRQVAPGEWECLREFECRPPGPLNGGAGMLNSGTREQGGEVAQSSQTWSPSGNEFNQSAVPSAHFAPRAWGAPHAATGASKSSPKTVWCARHGKRILLHQCNPEEESCYCCIDSDLCLSTPLDALVDLEARGCKELLCSKHNTLRSVGFLELCDTKSEYRCIAGHACRHTTLQFVAPERRDEGGPQEARDNHDSLFEHTAHLPSDNQPAQSASSFFL